MDVEIKAAFKDRRTAELALEHLVQEIGLDRTDVFIAAEGANNTSGTEKAGGDSRGSLSEPKTGTHPKLEGEIAMSVGCEQAEVARVSKALTDAGARVLP